MESLVIFILIYCYRHFDAIALENFENRPFGNSSVDIDYDQALRLCYNYNIAIRDFINFDRLSDKDKYFTQ